MHIIILISIIIVLIALIVDYFDILEIIGIDIKNLNLDFWNIFVPNSIVIVTAIVTFFLIEKRNYEKERMGDYIGKVLLKEIYTSYSVHIDMFERLLEKYDDRPPLSTDMEGKIQDLVFSEDKLVTEQLRDAHISKEEYEAYNEIKKKLGLWIFMLSRPNANKENDVVDINELKSKINKEKNELKNKIERI